MRQLRRPRAGRDRPRNQAGAAAVEFALILVPFLAIVLGLIQYGFYFFAAQTGSNAANAAVRQVSVGNCQSDAALKSFVDNRITGSADGGATVVRKYYNPNGALVTSSPAPTNVAIGGTVTLDISFRAFNMHFPFVSFLLDPVVNRSVQARVEDTVDEGCGV